MTSVGENGNHQTGEEQVEMEVEVERSSNHYIMIATGGGN